MRGLAKGLIVTMALFCGGGCIASEGAAPKPVLPGPLLPSGELPPALPAVTESDTLPDHKSLVERVEKRWDALAERNFDQAYTYETPSYRALYNLEQFKSRFGNRVAWLGARFVRAKDKGNGVAEVVVKVRFKASVPGVSKDFGVEENPHTEKWVLEEGTWFHVTE